MKSLSNNYHRGPGTSLVLLVITLTISTSCSRQWRARNHGPGYARSHAQSRAGSIRAILEAYALHEHSLPAMSTNKDWTLDGDELFRIIKDRGIANDLLVTDQTDRKSTRL